MSLSLRLNMLLMLTSPLFIGLVLSCIGARGKPTRAPRRQVNDGAALCRPELVRGARNVARSARLRKRGRWQRR